MCFIVKILIASITTCFTFILHLHDANWRAYSPVVKVLLVRERGAEETCENMFPRTNQIIKS